MVWGSCGFKPNYEYEALSRRGKRTCYWKPGERKAAKRRYWKWMRKIAKRDLRREAEAAD